MRLLYFAMILLMENMKPKPNDNYELETEFRNFLQLELINETLGEKATKTDILNWISDNSQKLSDIFEDPKNDEIKDLARDKKYKEAASLVTKILKNGDIQKAA